MKKLAILIVGTFVGSFISYCSAYGLWKIQAEYEHKTEIKKSREELIVEASEVFAYAPIIKSIVAASMPPHDPAGKAISSSCVSAHMRGEKIMSCKKDIDYSFIRDFDDYFIEYNVRFQKLKNLSNLYFCEKTISIFENVERSKAWWEVSPEETKEILSIMHNEYECRF